jgi:hypothetical protein
MSIRMSIRAAGIAVAMALATLVGGASLPDCASAQGAGCADGCRANYGNCYRSTANRAACESQLQRCLQSCISAKR